jgi:ribosome-associated heat shock protein Hsp15
LSLVKSQESVRLDIWLWRARFFKTRALSAKACELGLIRLERLGQLSRITKAGFALKPKDRLIFALGTKLFDVSVMDLGQRRGPATEAQSLFRHNSE